MGGLGGGAEPEVLHRLTVSEAPVDRWGTGNGGKCRAGLSLGAPPLRSGVAPFTLNTMG